MSQYGDALRLLHALGLQHAYLAQAMAALGLQYSQCQFPTVAAETKPEPDTSIATPRPVKTTESRQQWDFPVLVTTRYQSRKSTENQPIQDDIRAHPKLVVRQVDIQVSATPQSLWGKAELKSCLRHYLQNRQNSQQLDLLKLTHRMAERQPIEQIPYQKIQRLPGEVWLYLDVTGDSLIHKEDQAEFETLLQTQLGKNGIGATVELLSSSPLGLEWRAGYRCDRRNKVESGPLPLPAAGGYCLIVATHNQLRLSHWRCLIRRLQEQQVQPLLVPLATRQAWAGYAPPCTAQHSEEQAKVLAALSLTPQWISLAMIRDLRLQLTSAAPELEQHLVKTTGVNWSLGNQVGEWSFGFEAYQALFETVLEVEQQLTALAIIQQHLPISLESIIQEHRLMAARFCHNWRTSAQGLTAQKNSALYFQKYASGLESKGEAGVSLGELEWRLAQAQRLQNTFADQAEVKRCFTLVNLLWQQKTGSNERLAEVDIDLWAEFKQQHAPNITPGQLHYHQGLLQPSRNPTTPGTTLVELEDIDNLFVENNASLSPPALNRSLYFKTTQESVTLTAFNSKTLYWAKSLAVTASGVVAETDYIRVTWPASGEHDGPTIERLPGAPIWLNTFPPALDQYGLYSKISVEDITFKLRYIPPGSFLMGSPPNEPGRDDGEIQHPVILTQGYWLGETAVSQPLWQWVMGKNNSHFKPENDEILPVENVSWDECQAFCDNINQRLPGFTLSLPSEAQWEYACRAGTQTPFSTGWQLTTGQANYDGNYPYHSGPKGKYRQKTVAIDAFAPNPWGLWQMHGNLNEWVLDGMREYRQAVVVDPMGDTTGSSRALRGGGWGAGGRRCRSADRYFNSHGGRWDSIGLRVAQVESAKERTAPAAQGLSGARTGKGEGRESSGKKKFSVGKK